MDGQKFYHALHRDGAQKGFRILTHLRYTRELEVRLELALQNQCLIQLRY
jgi:hypothetical protein